MGLEPTPNGEKNLRTRPALSRRIAGALTISALAVGSTLAAGALSPAAAVSPIPTGALSGTVVGASGAIPGASVEIYGDTDLDGAYDDVDQWSATGITGDYSFDHLRPGNYKIQVWANGYDSEYYADAVDEATATPVAVAAGNVAVPPVSLSVSTYSAVPDADTDITGVVTNAATGKPVVGASVTAYNSTTGDEIDWASTDGTGRYVFDDLAAGAPVKLAFYRSGDGGLLGYRTAWSGGARTKAAATQVVVTPGTAVTVSSALTQYAGVTGKVLNPSGGAPYDGWVTVYDADSGYQNDARIRPDGTYYIGDLDPGQEYRVLFTGAFDYPGNDTDADANYYFDQWYANGNSFTSATALTAGASGSWTPGIGATLRDTLVALEQPSVSGDFVVGKTLTANKGRWNRNGNSTFGYEWLRGSAVVGTASTYALTSADAGQGVALRVTITNYDNDKVRTLSAITAAKVAKYSSSVSAKAKKVKKGKKAGAMKVTVSVKAGTQAAAATTGTVKVLAGKKKVATVKIKKGKGTFLVTKAGKHKYKLVYSGNASTLADDGKVTVNLKKAKKK